MQYNTQTTKVNQEIYRLIAFCISEIVHSSGGGGDGGDCAMAQLFDFSDVSRYALRMHRAVVVALQCKYVQCAFNLYFVYIITH